jgi:ribosomal protein L11 methyltransferase
MKNTLIYTIVWKNEITADEFSGFFADLSIEGTEEIENGIKVYVLEENKTELEDFLNEIKNRFSVTYTIDELENKNWNAQWESSFQPILIENYVLVRATFHPGNKNVQHEIIIEPKMSFGTGHHPTTSQMMQNMRLADFKNKTVLDCGSGTGILAILAEKSGAGHCIALDNDEWCFENCKENIQLNHSKNIQPEIGDLENVKEASFDIILANIHRNFLIEHMHTLSALLHTNGFLFVSGFYSEDAKIILDKSLEHNLISNYYTTQDNWACIVFQKI